MRCPRGCGPGLRAVANGRSRSRAGLSEDRERLWAQVSAADFLTPEEKREMAGFAALKGRANSEALVKNKTNTYELKFNPWHDNEDGQFAREGQGRHYGGGGSFGGGGVPGSWGDPKPKGGGSFGGGGYINGSWDRTDPKKRIPKVQQPKREVVKSRLPKISGASPTAVTTPKTTKSPSQWLSF